MQRLRQSKWFTLVWAGPLAIALLAVAVLLARWFVATDTGTDFLGTYRGASELPAGSPEGFPWWMQWQHALNFFFIVLIIRAGWMVHSQRQPEAYWTANAKGGKQPTKMSIYLWLHLLMDALWLPNGILFVVLLFSTGHWKRIVPMSWDVFPNAVSAGIQYLSLDWPANIPWVEYNSLQVLAYFVTVFIAAPLAAITGIRMSPWWKSTWAISKAFPIQLARAIHLPVMYYFVVFIVTHVALVFVTDMRLNLDAMYSWKENGSESWWGFGVFSLVLLIVIAGWVAARPMFMAPIASMTGRVSQR